MFFGSNPIKPQLSEVEFVHKDIDHSTGLFVAFDKASEKKPLKGNRGMPSVLPSSVADAKLAEKKAWRRYAEARDDNWREALAEWVEARNALLAAYAEEAASRHRF